MRVKTQERTQKLDEMISGIKNIKFNTWENLFADKVKKIRKGETGMLLRLEIIRLMSVSVWLVIGRFCPLIIFTLYVKLKGELDVSRICYLLLLFKSLEAPIV
jgi:hypothetical protein